jgi:FixJ family two-component response regulator
MATAETIVFVIDDDPSFRRSTEMLIGSAGLSVQGFSSAEEFLRSRRPDLPACLVLDVRLPHLSGLDLQRELAEASLEIPIIFITGHGDIPMTVQAMKAGAIEFLTKVREREVMAHVVAGMLNKQVANELGTTEKTIKVHRGHIMQKMGAKSFADLVRAAERLGILSHTS